MFQYLWSNFPFSFFGGLIANNLNRLFLLNESDLQASSDSAEVTGNKVFLGILSNFFSCR